VLNVQGASATVTEDPDGPANSPDAETHPAPPEADALGPGGLPKSFSESHS
jgi:hypothetical protein